MDRSRGEMRAQNFQRIPSSPSSGGFSPSGGGGGDYVLLVAEVVVHILPVEVAVQDPGWWQAQISNKSLLLNKKTW